MNATPQEPIDWLFVDYHGQRAALDCGQLTVSQLAVLQLKWIERWQPAINAFIALDGDSVVAAAKVADSRFVDGNARPLEGLLLGVKDNIDVAGFRTSAGMATRSASSVAKEDAPIVALLRAAGAIVLGKLNMHEAALGADNDNPHFGACMNPHRDGYTPGGSSGGSGAAVAAGFCPIALGSDSMGSIRIPASYCGVLGLKASFGAFSTRGSVRVSRRLDHLGPLARSCRDLQRVLDVSAHFDPLSAQSRQVKLADTPINRLTLGVPMLDTNGVDTDVAAAFADARNAFVAMGHAVVDLGTTEHDFSRARRAGLFICEAEMLCEHANEWKHSRELFSEDLARMLTWASGRSASDFVVADRRLDEATVVAQAWLQSCDFVLSPTTPQRAFAFGAPAPATQADLTSIANMAGLPAVSVPMPTTADELPAGLQLIGASASEAGLLALADSYLQFTEHRSRRPRAMQEGSAWGR